MTKQLFRSTRRLSSSLLLSAVIFLSSGDASAQDNLVRDPLDAGEVAALSGGAVGLRTVGYFAKQSARDDPPRWHSALGIEEWVQRNLGGSYYPGKTNFLDNTFGSAATAVVGLGIITAADFSYVDEDEGQIWLEDAFLFTSGIIATKGITDISKGLFRRSRPLVVLEPELASQREKIDPLYDQQSFFSGHTSSAFFAMAFTNLRIRALMREEMSSEEYGDWRWAPPTLAYGWATFVGWTRIHAYKHYLLDVFVGAAAGILMAELFYSFQNTIERQVTGLSSGEKMFRVQFSF